MSISVLILTRDEEVNLPACLASVAWCDDVVVLDSLSSDRTVEIARHAGARVFLRGFDTYSQQRNFGLSGIEYRHPWLLMLDADERVPDELREEMHAAIHSAQPDETLFLMRRRDHLAGRWIRHSSGYPTWFGRLARVGHVWVERSVNEEYRTAGRCRQLTTHLMHYPFNKGLSAWLIKHDRYSSMEASLKVAGQRESLPPRALFSTDVLVRRKAVKALVYRLPGRPVLIFLAFYVVRRGFMDGAPGLMFSLLRAWYEFMIDCKCSELKRQQQGLPL